MPAQKYPFQLRLHNQTVAEIEVTDLLYPEHKAFEVVQTLLPKFSYVIIRLSDKAAMHRSMEEALDKLSEPQKVFLVTCRDDQMPFKTFAVKRFDDIATALMRTRNEGNIATIVKQVVALPAMRTSAFRILSMLKDPDIAFSKIEEVLVKEERLADRMLKIANGANFARRTPFENLRGAVQFLGIEGIRQILIEEVFSVLTRVFVNQVDKLTHMRRCSVLAAHIGKLLGAEQRLFWKMRSAGLLHDLGSLALSFHDSQEYSRAMARRKAQNLRVCDAELQVFGITHQEVGEALASEMNIPEYLLPAIGHHHDSAAPEDDLLLLSVMIANGYMNSQIEQVSFTPYEHYLEVFARARAENNAGKPQSTVVTVSDAGDETPSEEGTKPDEVFSSPNINFYLKEELGKIMMCGYRTEDF
ncbi:hypothetical protein MASR1M12_21110 [Erysipelotrichia bacterium]